MKHLILAIAAVTALAISTPAFALGDCAGAGNCNDDNSTNQTTTNTNTATGGAGGSAVNGPNVNTNVNTAKGGDVSHSGNSFNVNDVDIKNRNKNTNLQGQKPGQAQGQFIDDSGNASINWQNQRETASAYSPALAASSETCIQSQSVGGQSPAFGISLGFSHTNEGCEMRRNAGMLFALGNRQAAVELLCSDEDVRDAMRNAGTPCAIDRPAAAIPTAANDDHPAEKQAALAPMRPVDDE